MELSVVVPAYNEAGSIASCLAEIVSAVEQLTADHEIIVVDDGSSDGTARCARLCAELYSGRIVVVESPANHGKGAALVLGAMLARGERIAFLDADLDLHPSLLHALSARMDETGCDAVIGSKRHPLSDVQVPPIRRVLSAGYFFMVRLLFWLPLRDTQTGIKIFKRDVLQRVLPRLLVKRFAFDLELLVNVHRSGATITDAPVKIRSQRLSQRIRYSDVKAIFVDTLAVFYRTRILRWYDRPESVRPMALLAPVISYGRLTPRPLLVETVGGEDLVAAPFAEEERIAVPFADEDVAEV
jgi:glycosyltransferase involved in cell wall biosynthesis